MTEGNEINPEGDSAEPVESPQAETSNSHSEMELVFVLILVGMLGIGIFLYVVFGDDIRSSLLQRDGAETAVVEISNEEMTSANYSDVEGRDENVLGLAIHKTEGRYYTHPESGMTLYTNTTGECNERCAEYFTSHVIDGEPQKTPQGESLYLYVNDVNPGDVTGDGFDTIWKIARP